MKIITDRGKVFDSLEDFHKEMDEHDAKKAPDAKILRLPKEQGNERA